ncbi:23S rRNA (guanosine(2251)-2'-O)-methyltransferase RlmB [Endozoicomonas sp. SM1973]|uniref:23S rRNA (guanosine-2'-O-)-methyltransferase RlmB n=1 Tax=Spartinivicinus marinus TaxID=2994442 RepID=A0A853I539_9GAMM|nr:23S rRNA (guanosine(2251)-2'-O)-methyltransferase RlmB [Spartinivicinus marinus]MCX4027610.1 23S rRNA (guanosine(2251)-2'-O)-methyltransferase RlmB [Spartinivicinus marinus]NYZ66692.1 23S rRNA (guanosine(2251)-2'-O)-methyltransferase RlmB [Spartinivicinus marinus]
MSKPDWVIGVHAVQALLEQHPEQVIELNIQQVKKLPDRLVKLTELAHQYGVRVSYPDKAFFRDIAGVHQGVLAKVKPITAAGEKELAGFLQGLNHAPLLLILDGVTDPHNLGACLRTADAAGVDAVIIPKDKSAGLNTTVRKVACGAAETMPLFSVTNLARTLKLVQELGIWIVGTAGESEQTVYDVELSGAIALVMGAEGKGMRRLTREYCDYLVNIPMAGTVSSLNVSVATGVCLFEAVRQRRLKQKSSME